MDKSMLSQISALQRKSVAELQAEWIRLYGEPTRSRNKQFLYRRIAWRIQELQHGGLSDHARSRIDELAATEFTRARTPQPLQGAPEHVEMARGPQRDPRLPSPGTVIVRAYKGRELRLVVHDDHFELDGQSFGSLSEAARHVTGSRWNGPLFWGVTKRRRG